MAEATIIAPKRKDRVGSANYDGIFEVMGVNKFVVRWSADNGSEIVRQEGNFSAPNSIREVEDYKIGLDDVTLLELLIVPDISGGDAHASLACLPLA